MNQRVSMAVQLYNRIKQLEKRLQKAEDNLTAYIVQLSPEDFKTYCEQTTSEVVY